MKNTVTEASIYEAQGLKDEALEIYKNILKEDPITKTLSMRFVVLVVLDPSIKT
ncbi:Uncharacterised protein [Campylobacter jejuni]|nr:Uncharacterised protein [Campylobacter jejuni]